VRDEQAEAEAGRGRGMGWWRGRGGVRSRGGEAQRAMQGGAIWEGKEGNREEEEGKGHGAAQGDQKRAEVGGVKESWAARFNTWLLLGLTSKGVVFSFWSQKAEGLLGHLAGSLCSSGPSGRACHT